MTAETRDMDNAAYHASEGLSASGAKLLLPPSCPAIYRYRRDHPEHKDVYDFGSAAHKIVLGDEDAVIVEVDAPDWRAKEARAAKSEARATGKIPLLSKDLTVVHEMATKVKEHPLASWLLAQPGKCEQSIFWTDERTGTPLRARLDYLPDKSDGRTYLADYKTAESAESVAFSKSVMNNQYHLQSTWHSAGARALGYDDIAWFWIVQEKKPPYVVNVFNLDPLDSAIGEYLMRQAIDVYRECVKADEWPGYSAEVETVSFPPYYTKQFEDVIQ